MDGKQRLIKAVAAVIAFSKATAKWVVLTLLSPWRLQNIKELLIEVTALLEDAIARQADPTLSLVRSANQAIANNNLAEAESLYGQAIKLDPMKADTYVVRAKALTYLIGNPLAVDQGLTSGLNINKIIAEKERLDILNLKILGNDFAGMGHLSLLDPLIKLKTLGLIKKNHIMIVSENAVANFAYLNCWKKYLPIVVTNAKNYAAIKSLFSPIYEDISMLEAESGFVPLFEAWNLALNSWGDFPPLLELTPEQKEAGDRVLEEIGLPKGSWFVGLHVREGAKGGYLRSGADADVLDYLPAVESIIEKGGWVIRMGKGGKPINKKIPNLWDYANSEHQSDWLDVYLWASCKFFIGTSSGPLTVPPTFGKPVLYTNACSLGHSPSLKNSLMIPKLLWSNKTKSFLNFKEILDGPYGWTVRQEYDEGQTKLVSNSPGEILAAVDEMMNALAHPELCNGKTTSQEVFDRIREPFRSTSQIRIADSFLRMHSDLLD